MSIAKFAVLCIRTLYLQGHLRSDIITRKVKVAWIIVKAVCNSLLRKVPTSKWLFHFTSLLETISFYFSF